VTALIDLLELAGQVALLHCHDLRLPGGESLPELTWRVWNLEQLEPHYHDFIHRIEENVEPAGAGQAR